MVDGVVYFPDLGGTIWAVDAANGQVFVIADISSETDRAGRMDR
ncbi:hypothetical protein [Paraburkholderia dinghuensis]|uniref:Uncharacterized protein n=1 Tax=Paraburkholderia dinghuensis TaxID=2305225 RepID=A0A3N6MXK7_9BURK|nr:hypothetical protein D1Y85_23935 [Paraburkholderia dinghuensis]